MDNCNLAGGGNPTLPALSERLEFMRRGLRTKRWHTETRIASETVGHHTAGTLDFLYLLTGGEASLNLVWALKFHDAAEHVMGDLPAPSKRALGDGFGKAFATREEDLLNAQGLMTTLTPFEQWLLKACDILDGLFSVIEERQLGNQTLYAPFRNYLTYLENMLPEPERIPYEITPVAQTYETAWQFYGLAIQLWTNAGGTL